jgi:phosphate transport system protein
MTRHDYQDELRRLRETVLEQLDVVVGQVSRVIEALDCSDPDACDAVVAGDDEVDRLYRHIQSELVSVIARQAPVASDLRLITALLHISRLVERIGDQSVNVAKLVAMAGPPPAGAQALHASLVAMGRAAEQEVAGAAVALRGEDLIAAQAVEERDEVVDDLNRTCFQQAIELGSDVERRSWAMAMVLVSRALERMADNAVDVGSHLRFALTGTFDAGEAAPAG